MRPLNPPLLAGHHVQLEALRLEHVPALVAAAQEDRHTYEWTAVPDAPEAMQQYVEQLLDDHERGLVVPFAQRRRADGAVVGCTRYMRLEWWGGREHPDEIEIGGTWLAASAQRTPLNTEAKLLLLRQAFDGYGVARVALCTDARNLRSRQAIERIGATFEGVLRGHRMSYVPAEGGRARDSALFAMTAGDWPRVEQALERRLAR